MEFIQFIPAFLKPKYNVLFGEHTLKYCLGMYDLRNNLLLSGVDDEKNKELWIERSSYAPFSVDFKSHIIDLKIPTEGVSIKYSKELYENKEEFYTVYLDWLKNDMGIDLLKDNIVISHFAHSCNGGLKIDEFARTGVNGLYAIGEVASIIEGANRLGGNSLGGSLVFANRAIINAVEYIKNTKSLKLKKRDIEQDFNAWIKEITREDKNNLLDKKSVIKILKNITSDNLGIVRSAEKVKRLFEELKNMRESYSIEKNLKEGSLEVYLMEESIKMLALSILNREESRGAHYREDFPETSNEVVKLNVKRKNNEFIIEKVKVK